MFRLIKSFIMTRGKFSFFNLILIFILSYYTIPLFAHESNYPFIYKYSLYYLIFLTFNICVVVFYLFACVITKNNRFLFYFVIISILTLEVVLRIVGQSPQGTKFKYSVPHIMWINPHRKSATQTHIKNPHTESTYRIHIENPHTSSTCNVHIF